MTRTKLSPTITLTVCLLLALSLVPSGFFPTNVAASSDQNAKVDKVASNLRGHDSPDSTETVSVILQLNASASGPLNALLNRNGLHVTKLFKNFNSLALQLPVNVIDELASYDEVEFISLDDQIIPTGHVSSTTGADDVRTQTSSSGASYTLDGTGIGIAIVDSGIYTDHKSIGTRVIYSRDFTGENRVDDPFGHGTHVAAAAAGNGTLYTGNYVGIAPNANLINLRVLDSQGQSLTSEVLIL